MRQCELGGESPLGLWLGKPCNNRTEGKTMHVGLLRSQPGGLGGKDPQKEGSLAKTDGGHAVGFLGAAPALRSNTKAEGL